MSSAENGDKSGRAKIVWGSAALQKTSNAEEEEAREKHRQRAARFKTDYVEPNLNKKKGGLEEVARPREPAPRGRAPIRLYNQNLRELPTPEELQKRHKRAQRFKLLEYETTDAAEEAKRKRAAKFGLDYKPTDAALAHADLAEERKDVPADAPAKENAVHLYGVDLMDANDVLAYFKEYSPQEVEWLSDSSCNVVFDDSITAKKAIVQMGKPLPEGEEAPDSHAQEGLDKNDIRNLPFFWHKGPDFLKDGTEVPLLFRMATNDDVRDPNAPRQPRMLWKEPPSGRRGGKARSGGKRTQSEALDGPMDEDGDVMMKRRRKSRGGVKNRRRARGMQIDSTGEGGTDGDDMDYEDIDMDDAEDWEEDGGEAVDTEKLLEGVEVEPVGVSDLRELLSRKQSAGLFSAAAAGVRIPGGDEENAGGGQGSDEEAEVFATEDGGNRNEEAELEDAPVEDGGGRHEEAVLEDASPVEAADEPDDS